MSESMTFPPEEVRFHIIRLASCLAFVVFGITSVVRAALNNDITKAKRIFWALGQFLIWPLIFFYAVLVENNKVIRAVVAVSFVLFMAYAGFPTDISKRLAGVEPPKHFNEKTAPPTNIQKANDTEVMDWAVTVAQKAVSFDYKDSSEVLDRAQTYFTADGWHGFNDALNEARLVELVKKYQLSMSLKPTGAPEIRDIPADAGVNTWLVQFPMEMAFNGEPTASPSNTEQPRPIIGYLILRIEQRNNGLGIAQWILSPDKKPL